MTDQSKYARAIEAIRTKEFYLKKLNEAIVNEITYFWREPSVEDVIKVFKIVLPGWWYTIGDCKVSADASIGAEGETQAALPFEVEHGSPFDRGFHHDGRYDTDLNPSPAKSLLIVMLMALEEMDKRGEA